MALFNDVFVKARYTTNAAQALTSSPTRVNFEDVDYDPSSLVTIGASWVFTAPATGYYRASVLLTLASATWTADDNVTIYLYKNAGAHQCIGRITGMVGDTLASCSGSGAIYLTAGETLSIFASQSSATASLALYNDGQFNHVAIERVG